MARNDGVGIVIASQADARLSVGKALIRHCERKRSNPAPGQVALSADGPAQSLQSAMRGEVWIASLRSQ